MYLRNLITLFLLLNIYSFYNSKEAKEEYCIESIKSSSLLFKMKKDMLIALKCYQDKYGYWSSVGENNGKIEDKKNWYYVRKGFIGDHTISLESSVQEGYFWRATGSGLKLDKYEYSDVFLKEASFIPTAGIEDYLLLSLRSYAHPKNYVRHYRGSIIASGHKAFDDFDRDATWKVVTPKDVGLDLE